MVQARVIVAWGTGGDSEQRILDRPCGDFKVFFLCRWVVKIVYELVIDRGVDGA